MLYRAQAESVRIGYRIKERKIENFKESKWVGLEPFGCPSNAEECLEKIPELISTVFDFFQIYSARDYFSFRIQNSRITTILMHVQPTNNGAHSVA